MTEIIHNLYLGSMEDAFSETFMKKHPTAVLNVTKEICKSPYSVDYLCIPLTDKSSERIINHFSTAINFIDFNLKNGNRVLVHCFAGISRSASFVIAYIMNLYNLSLEDGRKFVKCKRPIINPNMGFIYQLYSYETMRTE